MWEDNSCICRMDIFVWRNLMIAMSFRLDCRYQIQFYKHLNSVTLVWGILKMINMPLQIKGVAKRALNLLHLTVLIQLTTDLSRWYVGNRDCFGKHKSLGAIENKLKIAFYLHQSIMIACCWLLVVDCLLLIAYCWLLVADCWLLIACGWLLVADCLN